MKAILYARYSPRPSDSDSLESQESDLREWCRSNGHQPVKLCADPAISGTTPIWSRPGLTEALESLQPGNLLVVRNLNRLARSVAVAVAIEEFVRERRASLASIEDGGILPDNRNARLLRVIRYAMSEYEREELNARTSRRMKQHQDAGRCMGAVPLGYQLGPDGKTLVPNRDEQRAAYLAAGLHRLGVSLREIAERLHKAGFEPRGKRWHHNTVRRLIATAADISDGA